MFEVGSPTEISELHLAPLSMSSGDGLRRSLLLLREGKIAGASRHISVRTSPTLRTQARFLAADRRSLPIVTTDAIVANLSREPPRVSPDPWLQ
jgi:hypothetical protein